MKYSTSKHCYFGYLDRCSYVINAGSKQKIITDLDKFKKLVDLAYFCIEPKSIDEIKNFLSYNSIEDSILNELIEDHILIKDTINFNDRYSRNHLFYEVLGYNHKDLQNKISNLHVLIIGAGGIGNAMSFFFSSIGVKKISLVDEDIVEETNLNRQFLFSKKNILCSKVKSIKDRILEINPSIIIDTIDEFVTNDILNKSKNVDLLISSADGDYCLEMINKFCCKNHIPFLNIGYLNDISVIGPFYIPGHSSCAYCNSKIYLLDKFGDHATNKKIELLNKIKKAPSSMINNFFAASMASMEIIKFLYGNYSDMKSINHVLGIHNQTFELETLEILKNSNCKYCSGV